jgi:hypothetical protein
MKRKRFIILGGAISMCIAIAVISGAVRSWKFRDWEKVVLRAKDPSGIEVIVTGRETLVKYVTTLYVRGKGFDFSIMIDDDMWLGEASIFLDEPWILVANDGHVVAGFNKENQKILGEYDWAELPYLSAAGKGRVLASASLGAPGGLPVNYPQPH